MKKLFRKYPDVILAIFAVIFVALILTVFSWGIGMVITSVDKALNTTGQAGGNSGFNIAGAKALDLRGLVK